MEWSFITVSYQIENVINVNTLKDWIMICLITKSDITKIKILWPCDSHNETITQSQSMLTVFTHHQLDHNFFIAAYFLPSKKEHAAM